MFSKKLTTAILQKNSRVCVGLDPRLELIPEKIKQQAIKKHGKTFQAAAEAIRVFNRQVIDVVAPHVPIIKPQLAFYEQYGSAGVATFEDTVAYAHDNGFRVKVDLYLSTNLEKMYAGFTAGFIKSIMFAYINDCAWVNFDSDGPNYDFLPKYEW